MNSGSGIIKIFAGSTGREFAQRMCDFIGAKLGQSEVFKFSDGNTFVRVLEPVRDKDVYLVLPIATKPNDEFVELLFWMDAFKRASANSVTAIIPYFSYAKGDKKDEPRVSIRARVCAESIELAGADRVVTMDLHSPQVQGFFKIPVDNLVAMPILCEAIKTQHSLENLVVVSPDAGFAKTARKYAAYLKCPVAIGDKVRDGHDEKARVLEVIGQVEGKDAVIVDDFSVSGRTIISMTEELKRRGAQRVFACLTHGLFSQEGLEAIEKSAIEKLIITDTVCRPVQSGTKILTVSVAPFFAHIVRCIHEREPVSSMFYKVPGKLINVFL